MQLRVSRTPQSQHGRSYQSTSRGDHCTSSDALGFWVSSVFCRCFNQSIQILYNWLGREYDKYPIRSTVSCFLALVVRGRLPPPPPNTTTLGLSAHVCPPQPLHWIFRGSEYKCDFLSFVVHQDLKSSSSLVVKLYDTVKAVKICKVFIQLFSHPAYLHAESLHQARLHNLACHCDGLLSTVREYSQRFIGTEAGTEADEIERWVYPLCFTILDRC
jgi:hypothetical protein